MIIGRLSHQVSRWMLCLFIAALLETTTAAQWRMVSENDSRQDYPKSFPSSGAAVKVGDELPQDHKFRWLVGDLEIPESIGEEATSGKAIGLQVSCGDGGELYVDGEIQGRFDNDHPLLAILTTSAKPGAKFQVAIQVYGKVQGGGKFDDATLVVIPQDRIQAVTLDVQPEKLGAPVPNGLIGLSQGGGLSDYEDATAAKLKEGGFKWFRTDNVLTNAVKEGENRELVYDWTAFDQRVDFIDKVGADPILAVSYMPQVFDAVPDDNRQSAPRDYALWEELCYRAAAHSLERGKRVPYWEVWNEANTGWIKPGPADTGSDEFKRLYAEAVGKDDTDHEIVRRFEAYAKLYQATARGVLRADPEAKVGGPALASGPFENAECSHCQHGRGFARGLMLWCEKKNLPLDFVSWHEYFQPADVIAKQAQGFRDYLKEFPRLEKGVESFMVTEWNEAWWPDRPHDHELGAAWCADGMIRAMIPNGIDRPCFFYVKQGDMTFRGDWSMLMQDNRPKPTYNMARIFNSLSGRWLKVQGGDDDVCAVAAMDVDGRRLTVVLVNHRFRHPVRRQVKLAIEKLPQGFMKGKWQEFVIDPSHSNIFNDADRCELEMTDRGDFNNGKFDYDRTMLANSIVMLELTADAN